MTREGATSEPTPVRGICGCWTLAPIIVGHVQSASGGAGYTHFVCPDHVYNYPQRNQWDELPAYRWNPSRR
ncbi:MULTISPECIES: hypothetical protein [Streptomyces]|uniref:hypothetical protein n=1 Tax=Streptomyces TaxID=1883 RepID=UPI001E326A17|nr:MULTISPECIES: hypothetical protein [Streptomyces]UFQ15487.1 hypothetical protein J2N69_11065 [Streptomyces huasconensis]WCL85091.1 hypothetical protein PPN52_11075 [Streptomyces sp. JCM 35825]